VSAPKDLDITASRTADMLYLHIINTNRTESIKISIMVEEMHLAKQGKIFEITADPELEIMRETESMLTPVERTVNAGEDFIIPAASVSAIEYRLIRNKL
jgi:hypothetical protein